MGWVGVRVMGVVVGVEEGGEMGGGRSARRGKGDV